MPLSGIAGAFKGKKLERFPVTLRVKYVDYGPLRLRDFSWRQA
jgi:hypothetical protein